MALINKGWYGMFFTCEIWCIADVSSVSPSSEQTLVLLRRRANAGNVGYTPNLTGEEHAHINPC